MPLIVPQIVIDTSAIIAGLRSRRGYAYEMLNMVGKGFFDIHLSVPLVLEYEEVLMRELPELSINKAAVDAIIDYHCAVGTHHEIYFLWRPHLRDPSDDMVLELAIKANCNYIVTYNKRDFVGIKQLGVEAIDPATLLSLIGENR